MLPQCLAESDFVFEKWSENNNVKTGIAKQLGAALKPTAVFYTGTSGLSITEIAFGYSEGLRGHFFGVHMFNSPYSMSLCELTPTVYTDKTIQAELKVNHIRSCRLGCS